jgi:IS4 transposase
MGTRPQKIERLKRRADHLRNRINIEMQTRRRGSEYDIAELSALEWAIEELEAMLKSRTEPKGE